jgi:tetratricopeptide (TPR) repeat protein
MFGDDSNIPQIAERLGVDFVLEGSVRGAGDDLRITVQLINANANSNVWVESYDREISLDNLVAVQTDIGARVAAAISVETGLSFSLPPKQTPTVDAAAMDNYLQGLFYVRRVQLGGASREAFDAAIEHMTAAIEIDPDWAPPHAAIGLTKHFLATSSHLEPDRVGETFEEARLHLLQSLRIDPGYGPAYGSLAFIAHAWDLDFERAKALYDQARAVGHERPWGEAIMLRAQGRLDDAISQYRQAALNDPLSRSISLQLADTLRCAGRYDEAARHLDGVSQNHPDVSEFLWEFRAELSLKKGDLARARQIMDEHRNVDDPVPFAQLMALLGMREEAEAALAVIEKGASWNPRDHTKIAVALGQEDRALDYLQQVAERYPRYLTLIQCPDEIGPLADDPRFRRLLADAGIPVNVVRDIR